MKKRRQDKILEIIEKHDIETQEELIDRLCHSGFDVTQATVSRDIREMKISKVMSAGGRYKYVVPSTRDYAVPKFHSALTDSIIRALSAYNQVVIKTYPGLAQGVAAAIDAIDDMDILGCVAGDDTIIVVLATPEAAVELCDKLKHKIRAL